MDGGLKMKNLKITVNGTVYDVKVEEVEENNNESIENNKNFHEKPMDNNVNSIENNEIKEIVKAPISGSVVAVNVQNGDSVKRGDVLMVIEAMKMENEIVSPIDATVLNVRVKKGEMVESEAPLVFLS